MKKPRFFEVIKDARGFTMIEMAFAGIVLMGAVTTMMVMFDASISVFKYTTSRSLGTQLANEEMEKIRSNDYEQVYNSSPSQWPDDPSLTTGNPPNYKDVDDDGDPVLRTIITTTSPSGLVVENVTSRKQIDFKVRRYVLWVDDTSNTQAYKRLVVKVSWTKFVAGEIVLTTNYAKEDYREPRPNVSIVGVRSTNFDYFQDISQDTTLGADDSIRGPNHEANSPIVFTRASVNSAKATEISSVTYTLYYPNGLVAASTVVNSPDANGLFRWVLNSNSYVDGTGYLIKAEGVDDRGNSDVDALRINIDNNVPAAADNIDARNFSDSAGRVRVTWDWTPSTSDTVPVISRFIVYRKAPSSSSEQQAALPGSVREFIDTEAWGNGTYRVKAVDTAGNNILSTSKDRVRIKASITDLWPPSSVSEASATAISWKKAELIWSASTDTGSGVAGYSWSATDDLNNWTIVGQSFDLINDPITYEDPDLKPGKTYHYAAFAFDEEGNESAPGSWWPVTTMMR